MTEQRAKTGYAVGANGERPMWFLGGLVDWKAVGADTGGVYELVEQVGPAGYAAPLHTHARETEGFYVVEGELSMTIGGTSFRAPAGAFGYVPALVPHSFKVESATAKFLTFITPPGLQGYFDDLGVPAESWTLPPASLALPDEKRILEVATKYGTKLL